MALLPDDSTDLPDTDATDGAGGDGEGDEVGNDARMSTTPDIQMDSEQVQAAGLNAAAPGDEFTIKITVTNTDEGLTASVVPGSAHKSGDNLAPMAKGKQNLKGPADMGFGAPEEGFTPVQV